MFASRINVKPRHKQPSNFHQFRPDYDRLVMFGRKYGVGAFYADSKKSGARLSSALSSAAARPKLNRAHTFPAPDWVARSDESQKHSGSNPSVASLRATRGKTWSGNNPEAAKISDDPHEFKAFTNNSRTYPVQFMNRFEFLGFMILSLFV